MWQTIVLQTMIEMLVTRQTTLNGKPYAIGARICVDVANAAALLHAARARLVDPADLALVIDARVPDRGPYAAAWGHLQHRLR